MIYGFKHRGGYDLPDWADRLTNLYWYIRVEGRDKAKHRRYYRLISKEKFRLAQIGIDQALIIAVCRYLCSFSPKSGSKIQTLSELSTQQLSFDFVYKSG